MIGCLLQSDRIADYEASLNRLEVLRVVRQDLTGQPSETTVQDNA
jgi:hypothetical protein